MPVLNSSIVQTILQGSLRAFPPDELLDLLGVHGHSGTLELEQGGKRSRVVFRDGKIAWVDANDPAFELTSMLLAAGQIGKEQFDLIRGKGLAAAISQSLITPQHLA